VGGPSLGHTGDFQSDRFQAGDFLRRFLRHCRDRQVPLDFFSWHRYAGDPSDFARRAQAVRGLLDEYGFTNTESHLNEWNYLPNEDWRPMMREGQGQERERWSTALRGPKGAAFAAWTLISLQDAPVDMANYYTAEIQMFGLFNLNGVPQKTYYAFKAFRDLLDTPRRIATPPCTAGQVAVCAGLNAAHTRAAVLLSSFHPAEHPPEVTVRQLPWGGPAEFELYVVDAGQDHQVARRGTLGADGRLALSGLASPFVALLKLYPPRGSDRSLAPHSPP
jgi:hypothetical protein